MDEASAARFRKRAIFSATRRGFTEQSEDLAHDVILSWLEGGGQHQTIDHAVIDAVRRTHGRSGTPGHEQRRNLEQRAERVDALANRPGPAVDRDSCHDFERLIKPLESIDRAIVCLRFIWGFSEIEIASLFGITESRVCQRLGAVFNRLRHVARKGERAPEAGQAGHGEGTDGETNQGTPPVSYSFDDFLLD